MGRIATDVVLLPDETTMDRAIEINGQLIRNHRSEIVLGKEDRLPHISLAMGCIDEADLNAIQELLEKLAREAPLGRLAVTGVLNSTNSRGETTSLLTIERTAGLQSLHERVVKAMRSFFSRDVTSDMICDDVVTPSTLEWIRSYPVKASFDHFAPHITVGYGVARTDLPFPHPFRATRLALCHLGNHCTCRRILVWADLPLE
jgi:2'-5' RNA ligase